MKLTLGQELTAKEFAKATDETRIVRVEADEIFDLIFTLADGVEIAVCNSIGDDLLIVVQKLAPKEF